MENSEVKIPDKCSIVRVLHCNGKAEDFVPRSEIVEYEDCYEFEAHDSLMNSISMVVIMKSDISTIRFVKG